MSEFSKKIVFSLFNQVVPLSPETSIRSEQDHEQLSISVFPCLEKLWQIERNMPVFVASEEA
jgi:hypothetical protein